MIAIVSPWPTEQPVGEAQVPSVWLVVVSLTETPPLSPVVVAIVTWL